VRITVTAVNNAPVAVNDAYSVNENQTLTLGPAPQPVTSLTMSSQAGDYIGQGQNYSYTTANATFSAYRTSDHGVEAYVQGTDPSQWWYLDFAAPYQATLLAGSYPGATRWPFQALNVPGLDVSGEGRGSNGLTGQFTVLQALFGADGSVQRFDATFVQHSEGATPALTGEIKYQAAAAAPGVLANDTDVDANLLTAALVSGPAHGTLSLNADGTFSYTPATNFYGTDTFTYTASDGALTSNVATVTITVNRVNHPPVAANDSYATNQGTPLTVAAPGVLANDTDPDGDPLTAKLVTGPAHGSLTWNGDGSFTYTPDALYSGSDSFTYKANDGLADSNTATVALTVNPVNTAVYVKNDTATQGSWQGVYGTQGYSVVNDATSYPSYAQVNVTGAGTYTWAGSTTDVRALQKASTPGDRIAATYYSFTNFTIDVNLPGGALHKVALYLLDWDSYLGGRSERIDVLDAGTGQVLDTRSVTGFSGGEYLVWNLKGHVQFLVTNTAGSGNTCLVSGLFFDPPAPAASAAFVATDLATQGTWQGVYGAQGYNVVGNAASYPAYAQVGVTGAQTLVWAGSTTDTRALQKATNPSDRIAAALAAVAFTIDVNLTDGAQHRLGLYALDWDNSGRSERIDVVDVTTGILLDSRSLTNFSAGAHLGWDIRGHVQLRVTNTSPASLPAVVSGLFFDPPAPLSAVTFVATDATTQGGWRGVYGAQGYNVVADTTSYPAYAQVAVSGAGTYTWAGSTTDARALQKASNPNDRIAATWYSFTSFTIDVNFTDGAQHRIGLYLLDWDSYLGGRSERLDVLDAATGAVLDTRSVSNFSAGLYLTWNLKGHAQVRVTNTGPSGNTCVASGLFFDPQAAASSADFLGTDGTTQGTWLGVYGSQGFNVVGAATSYPAYAQVGVSGAGTVIWASSTTDVRALQKGVGTTDRIAAAYYSVTSFTIDVNLTDNAQHRLGLYALSWDSASRSERIDVFDVATGILLDSRNVTNFTSGLWLAWNLKGHVQIRVTNTGSANLPATVSGLFFDPPAPSSSVTFVGTDLSTQGSWEGPYGAQGYSVVNDATSYPGYAQVSVTCAGTYTWAGSTSDVRALQKATNPGDRIAATYYSFTSFTIDVNLTDGGTHRLALYLLDWDSYLGGRSERIDVVDAATGQVMDTQNVSNFAGGEYLAWNIKGHVRIRVTNTAGSGNTCLVSGLFFAATAVTSSATFTGTDLTTQGSWQGTYGAQGYSVVNNATSYPAYVYVGVNGAGTYTWVPSTTDVRALQKATDPTDRIAATYYSFSSFTIDLNLTDNAQHRLALYLLDWDSYLGGRSERIDVLDAGTGTVLDTHNITNFSAGEYLVWNLKGHVVIKITNTGLSSNTCLVSGLFFG
jgi:VCBS repeat-containing protein